MIAKTTANINAVQKPETEKPGTNPAAIITRKAFTTREKKPSVSIVRGSVRIDTTGRIKIFIKARTTASTTAPNSVTCTPGTRYAERPIATAETTQ